MNYTLQCYIDCGPKHREFRKEILQAMQVYVSSHQVQS
ncbi:predicted protein [Staphylococcus aureus A9754]|nr:predicted protein [Staphylococcus aureus A9754]